MRDKHALPPIVGPRDRPLIVIDPGHGGQDFGARGIDGQPAEKEYALTIAKAVRDELMATGLVRVALTRSDDRQILLNERFAIARRMGAALFVSIHCDGCVKPGPGEAKVYTLSEVASDKEAARFAVRENKVDVVGGVDLTSRSGDVSSTLIDLTRREVANASASFGRIWAREAKLFIPTGQSVHRMASLTVLKAPDLPSVLIEAGDSELARSVDGQRRVAKSVRNAVEIYLKQSSKKVP